MRFAWTDDYGFTKMYSFGESTRLIADVREAAMGFRSLGAIVEPTNEVWEDFFPGYVTTNWFFGVGVSEPTERPDRERWKNAFDVRQRNWQKFRNLFSTYDLLLSTTSQLLPASMEDWSERWGGKGPVPFPHDTFAPHYTSHTHMFNWLGFPAVSIPSGFLDGLPIGLQIVGRPSSEDKIFRAAQAFLKAFPHEEKPPVS
jgi:aspartyl-tRNA(Asn)/glutamyl-tRNA(Gln) amidotransferase subunit A